MSRETLKRRVEGLETRRAPKQPLVFVIQPVSAEGHSWETTAYECRHTGLRIERHEGEDMDTFMDRAEQEAQERASQAGALLIVLTPDGIEDSMG